MKEATFLGSNISQVKTHNVKAILLHLLKNKHVYRVELAEKTSLSTTTITNIIDELLEEQIVIEAGPEKSVGRRRVGRPKTAIRLIPNARYAIGVHIGFGMYRVALVDLRANVLNSKMIDFVIGESSDVVIEKIAQTIELIIDESTIDRSLIVGVGIGAPGLVNYRSGINVYSQNLNWTNVPIRDKLRERLNLCVAVDNNVRVMALGEAFFGIGHAVESLVFLYGRAGVGAGIVVGNRIFRGSGMGAGEIGHMVIVSENGEQCRCGQKGCLETLVSVPFIVEKAEAYCHENNDGLLCQYLSNSDDKKIDAIIKAAREGDSYANEIIENSACYLGIALANLVNLLNPELILLGGIFAQAEDLIIPKAEQIMRSASFGGLGQSVRITASQFGWKAGMIGAASLALLSFFYLDIEDI